MSEDKAKIKPSGMHMREREAVAVIEKYGRPPHIPGHLRKLGEEFGELSEAVALENEIIGFGGHQYTVDELADVLMVCVSLLDKLAGDKVSILDLLAYKRDELNRRMAKGQYDKKYGPKVR